MTAPAEPAPRALVVGTAGHVDHGKTALVGALTGVETDRWEEERTRGLTIDLGFAPLDLGAGLEVGMVDVPGHEDFIRNMLAGATGIDLLLLVVAADEGPMPQTREHLAIAQLLGVTDGVVAVSKVDRVEDPSWLELVEEAVREELRLAPAASDWPLHRVSAVSGAGLDALRGELRRRARGVAPRPADDFFRLPVDRAFTLPGAGTVVTGTVWSGRVARDATLRVLPGGREVRVRSAQVHGTDREEVAAGRRCGLAIVGVDPDEVPRGAVLVDAPGWAPAERLGVELRLLAHASRVVEDGQRVRVYHGTREAMARVRLASRGALAPGERHPARLDLETPLVARPGDRFVLRFYSPVETLGGGRVAELDPPGGWARRTEAWATILDGDPVAATRAAVGLTGGQGLAPERLPLATGRRPGALPDAPPEEIVGAGSLWFAAERLRVLEEKLLDALDRMHRAQPRAPAVSLEALRASTGPGFAAPLVERALGRLAEREALVVARGEVRRPDHRPRLTPAEESAKAAVLERLAAGGWEPPMVEELVEAAGGDRDLLNDLLELLQAEERVVAVSPDLFLPRERAERLRELARRVLRGRSAPASPGAFKNALDGVSRRYLIPYLEYLDRAGVTRRTAAGRLPAEG